MFYQDDRKPVQCTRLLKPLLLSIVRFWVHGDGMHGFDCHLLPRKKIGR